MKISSGAKKDLLILQFCHSMIRVSAQEETRKDDDLKNRVSNKNYHINKRIDRHLLNLSEKLHETSDSIYKIGGQEVAMWVKKNLPNRIGGTLTKIQSETINLEMLAIWVLYCNFAEKDRPLHQNFEWLRDANQYFKITEMMEQTEVSFLEEEMFKIAYDVINRIKS